MVNDPVITLKTVLLGPGKGDPHLGPIWTRYRYPLGTPPMYPLVTPPWVQSCREQWCGVAVQCGAAVKKVLYGSKTTFA